MKRILHLRRLAVLLFIALGLHLPTHAAVPGAGKSIVVKGGGELGHQINAADQRLGAACGTILVDPSASATVQTAVHLGFCHNLELQAGMSWKDHLFLSGKNKVQARGQHAVQNMLFTGPWAQAAGAAELELGGIWSSWQVVHGGDDGNRLLLCRACSDVAVHDTHTSGGGYLKTDSTARAYAEVNAGNSSYRIRAERNFVDGRTGPDGGIAAAWYAYTWDVEDTNETIQNTGLAITWWGGNNNNDWTSYDPATLKAGRMHFSNGSARNVVAGWWGCMGQHIRVEQVTVDGCQDVCLDSEGDVDVRFTHFFATNAVNGELSTFFHSKQIVFSDGSVQHHLGAKGHSFFNNNATNDPERSHDVTLERIAFACADSGAVCTIVLDPVGTFTLRDSQLTNTRIMNSIYAGEQGDELILSNVFTANTTMNSPWTVLDLSTYGYGRSFVCGNRFLAERPQPAGSFAVLADNAYNNRRPGKVLVAANETHGWPASISINATRNTTHFPAHVILKGNRFPDGVSINQDGNITVDSEKSALGSDAPPACLASTQFQP